MRSFVVCVLAACSEPSHGAVDAGQDTSATDASTVPTCGLKYAFDADMVRGLAVNGSELVIATSSPSGFALQALATSDGTVTTIASGSEPIPIATHAGVAFYAVGESGAYAIHQRAGTADTVLGAITSTARVELGASATDVYVLAQDATGARVWRIARAGGSAPVEVMTFSAAASNLNVGTTNVSVFSDAATYVMTQPGPATPTTYNTRASTVSGDLGFVFATGLLTQNTHWWGVSEVFPQFSMVAMGQSYKGQPPAPWPILADDRYLYVGSTAYSTTNPPHWATFGGIACSPSNVYDDTNHYRAYQVGAGKHVVIVAPRPL